MPRSNIGSRQHSPDRIIPARGQVPKYALQSPVNKHWGILHEHVSGSNLANDSGKLPPEARARAGESLSKTRRADVLARETTRDNEVGSMFAEPSEGVGAVGIVGAEGLHVVPDWEAGEAVLEDALGIRLDLDGADGPHADEEVGKQAAARSGEQMQGVKGTIHGMMVQRLEGSKVRLAIGLAAKSGRSASEFCGTC